MRIVLFALLLSLGCSCFAEVDVERQITVDVDATEISRRVLHTHLTLPVRAGGLTLFYPKWIPGNHAPTGNINSVVGLQISVNNNQALSWRRDLFDEYAIHCEVPAGASSLGIDFDYLITKETSSEGATAMLGILSWHQVILYPSGSDTDHWTAQASLKPPPGWKIGTALPIASEGKTIKFKPVSLSSLVDSPVVMGVNYRHLVLAEGPPNNEMDIVADTASALSLSDARVDQYRQLVTQARFLFGATHYDHYHFLVMLTDQGGVGGLEHHESSSNAMREKAFTDNDAFAYFAGLLPHEFVHSWNGKYRRPVGLATPDFQKPMQDDLLWVYEGLTEYLGGFVLVTRSGLRDPEFSREHLAQIAAQMDYENGRSWRSLQDTADDAHSLHEAPKEWQDRRRSVDYYPEGTLLWLEADVLIRQRSNGSKSLDDFCRDFHGGKSGPPLLKTYTLDDVLNGLNDIASLDWRGFWTQRLEAVSRRAPLNGIEASGWRLIYNDQANHAGEASAKTRKTVDAWFSLGITAQDDGAIIDVRGDSPADKAKAAPGMKIVAVNSRKFTAQLLNKAIQDARAPDRAIELLVNWKDYFETFTINYHDGLRYPHLERDPARPDLLSEILKPRTS